MDAGGAGFFSSAKKADDIAQPMSAMTRTAIQSFGPSGVQVREPEKC
jgi:hypothetical protein